MTQRITIIGGGLAGVEAAWAAANRGSKVTLYEMRPTKSSPVHRSSNLAEIVCSNSFKSNLLTNASGVLKQEMRRLGSITMRIAAQHSLPAGEALAVDRERFSHAVTEAIEAHPNISVVRDELTSLPDDRPLIIATGPLTSDGFAHCLAQLTGGASLHFFDAVAPTVTLDSLDMSVIYRASRRGKELDRGESKGTGVESGGAGVESRESRIESGSPDIALSPQPSSLMPDTGDYLNCPFTKQQFHDFWQELVSAELAPIHNPDDAKMSFFEMCVPVEELARRGERTLCFGTMKPIGLDDPRTGRRPWAVAQLRQENAEGTLWGLVGFQTQLKWGEQKRVFRMIPGLQNAEFVRYGVMHRNTYVNAPLVLDTTFQLRQHPSIYLAGQITGVEGYVESAASGLLAGINAHRAVRGFAPVTPPRETVLGALCHYLVETEPKHFSPMNANFGVVPELPVNIRDKREKARLKGERALQAFEAFAASLE